MVLQRSFVSVSLILALASCGGDDSSYSANDTNTFKLPDPVISADPIIAGEINYTNVAVHDPSIIKDDGTYYVFGSHLAVASSKDLINWTQVASDGVETSSLFDTYATEIAEGTAWTGGFIGSWAPDIKKLADGKYHFYYNFCGGPTVVDCVSRSYLGMATSDNIMGPYVNQGLLFKSGHVGMENPGLNGQNYNGNTDPNAIDPAIFYDKDGGLWMSYGSYSGGIWVMQLDPTTGKPLADQGYGTKIMGGGYSAIEGSYVIYSPQSEYYYMFTSFGGFAQNDGYNIRISRSKNPNGPYVDASGQDMIGATGNLDGIAPYGVKLMGDFLFEAHPGDVGKDHGYMSPGHNSAFYDVDTDKYFLVLHTRFPDTDENHSVRVHEMFMNSDGWLVASPQRYAPISGDNIVDEVDITGAYQFINHAKDINTTPHKSVYIQLTRTWTNKGSVTGDVTGTYIQGDDNQITLTLDDLGSFEGVLAWQWDENLGKLVPTFSALSTDGVSIWGSKLLDKTTDQVLTDIANGISIGSEVTESTILLPKQGTHGATINWASSDEDVIRVDGTVIRPNAGEEDKVVTLTATIMVNGKKVTKTFQVTVFARKLYNRIAQYSFENNLTDSLGLFAAGQPTGDKIFKTADSVAYSAGFEGEALALDGAHGVLLPTGIISSYEYTVSFWANPTVITGFSTAFFGAVNEETAADGTTFSDTWISMLPQGWDGNTMFWSNGSAWFDGVTGERIPENTWSHVAFSVSNGLVRVFINGIEKFSRGNLSDYFSGQQGVFGLGVNYWDLPYNGLLDELKVYEAALTSEEIKALDIDKLPDSELLSSAVNILDLGDLSSVRGDVDLPFTGPYAAAISWVSSDPTIIDTKGRVNQPSRDETDKEVTLTATIKLGQATQTKVFTANVKSMAPPKPIAIYSFEDNLIDSTANFGAGNIVGNLIGTTGGEITFAEGAVGKAAVFNGASGIELPNNLIKSNRYSVSLWLNPKVLNKYTSALFSYASASSWTSVLPGGQNDYERMVLWSGEAWYDGRTGFTMPKDAWSHMVYTVSSGDVKVYINGKLLFTGANFPDIFSASTTRFAVGVNLWDVPFTGAIDEIKFYDEAVTEQDVQELFNESTQ